jgi:hypothetical protein
MKTSNLVSFLLAASLAPVMACGGSSTGGQGGSSGHSELSECAPMACGPEPFLPAGLCDGGTASSACTQSASGACEWTLTCSGGDAGGGDASDGGICVDIDLSTYDQTCTADSDCIIILSGEICSNDACLCAGGSSINKSGQARYDAALPPVTPVRMPCSCPASGAPTCIAGTCHVCGGVGSNDPACGDAGDAGDAGDGG